MKTIVVAVDFDQNEDKVVKYAAELASRFDAMLWLVHCAAPDPDFVSLKATSTYERDSRADELREEHRKLRELAKELQDKGQQASALLIQGPTVETVLEKARDLKADMLIAGLYEHGFLYNAFVGNTALQILRKTDIPVLFLPLGD